MLPLLLILAVVSFSPSTCLDNTTDTLAVTLSPRLWSLLETKAQLISDAVTSINIPDFKDEKTALKYGVFNGKIEHFSIPKNGISFMDIDNGIHLSMKNIQLQASIRAQAEVGFKLFKKWRRIALFYGDVRVLSQNTNLDVILKWDDFKFIPKIDIALDLRFEFTHHLRLLNFLRNLISKVVISQVQSRVPKMAEELILKNLNPLLQNAKGKLVTTNVMNLNDFDNQWAIQWIVQEKTFKIALKPKSMSKILLPVAPIKSMICVDANMREMLLSTLSEKFKSSNNEVIENAATTYNVACVNPQFVCDGLHCQFCTDIDISPASELNLKDSFISCLP